ncbi:MAG: N-acylmannosamine kinase [Candidatus Parcubacteria bacterium]|nr:MAG: N-acylmannosamine kinase [Candidatus Parcubacteria bacterium]
MYLVGDVGGTKTRLGVIKNIQVKRNKIFNKIYIFNTPQKYKEFLNLISQSLKQLKISKIKKVCFGFAGNFDTKKEKLIYSPNLKDYVRRNLKRDLEKILNNSLKNNSILRKSEFNPRISVVLENDATLAGLGEGYFGAGKNLKSFGYITLSTGIGGVKIIQTNVEKNKKILKIDDNVFGFEPGHSFILIQSKTYNVLPIEIEKLIGGKSLEKIFKERPEKIKDKKIWDNLNKILAIFLVNVSIFWSVDKIILGGGLVNKINFTSLSNKIIKIHPLRIRVDIIKTKLKEFAGLYGGLFLIKSSYYK